MITKRSDNENARQIPANTPLLPAQRTAYEAVAGVLLEQHCAVLYGGRDMGKTTILGALHAELGGACITSREIVEASGAQHPLALEETIYQLLYRTLSDNDVVIVDDLHMVAQVMCCTHSYPRLNYLAAAMLPLIVLAEQSGKKLVFGMEPVPVPGLERRIPAFQIEAFTPDDFAALCLHYMGVERSGTLDMKRIHRFAPRLNARQIRNTCEALRGDPSLDTDIFLEHLRKHHMVSNVDLGEVQPVSLQDLKGLDGVLDALDANVILPLENATLAEELELRSKRGVLLAGPPGTGKTTIGRALAHRLKSKFFLIDGTVITGTPNFYHHIQQVFEAARENAPAIIFIDDSDVIFEAGQETGFYRYLLTMLDGLESASAGRICLMMTAMDVGSLPPALVRSGRIELWLETHLPDADARKEILADLTRKLPLAYGFLDVNAIAAVSEGLTGADLKRVMEDGKLLFAHDRARGRETLQATEYFVRAIETVRRNKEQYAEAERRARSRHPTRPPYFDVPGMGGWMGIGDTEVVTMIQEMSRQE